jgi:aminoglycoside 3-N-acetyltransferase I
MSGGMQFKRLVSGDEQHAKRLFLLMAAVFSEDCEELSDRCLARLLSRDEFWAIAAFSGSELIGGLTAHTLPMTRSEASEIFIYDIAVHAEHQRKGVGRGLVAALREAASALGIDELFVPADNDDRHALDFYRALGGTPSSVTFFSFSGLQKT